MIALAPPRYRGGVDRASRGLRDGTVPAVPIGEEAVTGLLFLRLGTDAGMDQSR